MRRWDFTPGLIPYSLFRLTHNLITLMSTTRIRHTVVFKTIHPVGSAEEQNFLDAGIALSAIPGVENFECLREISPKNDYVWGFLMEFADQSAYDAYNQHPDHVSFVENRWMKEVEIFQEIDYQL